VGALRRRPAGKLPEIAAPLRAYARRITQVLLVERVEEIGVAAVQGCRFEHGKQRIAGPIV
jgi:hypothetical protein